MAEDDDSVGSQTPGTADPRTLARRILEDLESLTEDDVATRVSMLMSGDRTEEFLVDLEQKLILGTSRIQRILWARNEYDVDEETLSSIEALLKQGHRIEMINVVSVATKRFKQVQRHMLVFQKAMEADDFKEANKALEQISKIEGLLAPDTTVNVSVSAKADVTSKLRERIGELQDTARRRFEERKRTLAKGRLMPVLDAESTEKEVG